MEDLLREVLAEDRSLLCRRDELTAALEKKVPPDKSRDFAAIKRALSLNVGEKFFVGDSDRETTKVEVAKVLKEGGLQEARINFVVDTFVKALEWDKPKESVPEKTAAAPVKVNVVKAEPKKVSPAPPATPQQSPPTQIVQSSPPPVENISREDNFRQPQAPTYRPLPRNHKSKIFTTEGRLNRWAYFLQGLKVFGLMIIGSILAQFIIGIPIMIAAVVGGWMISIRRMHDLNKSGWWLLISLIPYVDIIFSIYVIFAPGTRGDNRYGADPLTE